MRTLAALTPASSASWPDETVRWRSSASITRSRTYSGSRATVASGMRRVRSATRATVPPLVHKRTSSAVERSAARRQRAIDARRRADRLVRSGRHGSGIRLLGRRRAGGLRLRRSHVRTVAGPSAPPRPGLVDLDGALRPGRAGLLLRRGPGLGAVELQGVLPAGRRADRAGRSPSAPCTCWSGVAGAIASPSLPHCSVRSAAASCWPLPCAARCRPTGSTPGARCWASGLGSWPRPARALGATVVIGGALWSAWRIWGGRPKSVGEAVPRPVRPARVNRLRPKPAG